MLNAFSFVALALESMVHNMVLKSMFLHIFIVCNQETKIPIGHLDKC